MEIKSFESMDEYVAYMEKMHQEADERTLSAQREIGYGDFAMSIDHANQIVIIGRVYTWEEEIEGEREEEMSDDDWENHKEDLAQRYQEGYRFGFWASAPYPEGELGSHHISALWKLSEEDYENAKENGWTLPPDRLSEIYTDIFIAAYQDMKIEGAIVALVDSTRRAAEKIREEAGPSKEMMMEALYMTAMDLIAEVYPSMADTPKIRRLLIGPHLRSV